jgi:PBP1b-binding outer membrane lipoprotein LpoB
MKGRLVAGALVALTLLLGGCVAQTADEDPVAEAHEQLTFTPPEQVTGPKQHLDDGDVHTTPVLMLDEGDDDGDPTDPDPNPWAPARTSSDPGSPNETTTRKH